MCLKADMKQMAVTIRPMQAQSDENPPLIETEFDIFGSLPEEGSMGHWDEGGEKW